MLANEQIIVSFGSSLTLPMCIASIWNINGKLQTHRGQVIATKHHLDKIGAVPTNLTYGGNVVDYIIPHEFFYMVGSTIKLASTIPIKEDNYDATNVKYGILLHFCSWSKYICNPKHALWQLEPPPHIDCCHMSMVNTFTFTFTYLPMGKPLCFHIWLVENIQSIRMPPPLRWGRS